MLGDRFITGRTIWKLSINGITSLRSCLSSGINPKAFLNVVPIKINFLTIVLFVLTTGKVFQVFNEFLPRYYLVEQQLIDGYLIVGFFEMFLVISR